MRAAASLSIGLAVALGLAATLASPAAGDEVAAYCQALRTQLAVPPDDPVERAQAAQLSEDCEAFAPTYLAALSDAAFVEPGEILDSLRRVPGGPAPDARRQRDGRWQRLVVIWSDARSLQRFYDPAAPGKTPPGSPRIWVTLAPKLRDWCRSALAWPDRSTATLAGNARRVSQRLGIPPSSLKSRFAELWVDEAAILRPCADPDPSAAACGLDFPDGVMVPGLTAAVWFRWFGDNVGYSYRPQGAPWTRLGYTYDWGPDAATPVPYGASEFMLAPDAVYEVAGRFTLDEYCAP